MMGIIYTERVNNEVLVNMKKKKKKITLRIRKKIRPKFLHIDRLFHFLRLIKRLQVIYNLEIFLN